MALHPFWVVFAGAALTMCGVWWIQVRTRNAGYVDVAWSYLMAGAAIYYAATGAGAVLPRVLVALLATLWGARLGTHLLIRVSHEPEDGRYRYLRTHWRDSQVRFFAFFMFQAALTAILSLPYYVVAQNPVDEVTPWTVVGLIIWSGSVAAESLADRQLARFRADPANNGKVCDVGLWRYSRHPNYFFEWLHWFAYVALAVGAPMWWLSALGPLLMGAALCWVTGIPFVEAQSLRSRGDAYREYQRTTSAFVPWFRR